VSKYRIPKNEDEVLPNKLGITDPNLISIEETKGFAAALQVSLENLTDSTPITLSYLLNLHFLALQHLYEIAGKVRTLNISKDGFLFPSAHFLDQILNNFSREMLGRYNKATGEEELYNAIADVHAELLYIHPFREGNGRTARLLAELMTKKSQLRPFDFSILITSNGYHPEYIRAVQAASRQDYAIMRKLLRSCL
jgi:cell filamentation protein